MLRLYEQKILALKLRARYNASINTKNITQNLDSKILRHYFGAREIINEKADGISNNLKIQKYPTKRYICNFNKKKGYNGMFKGFYND